MGRYVVVKIDSLRPLEQVLSRMEESGKELVTAISVRGEAALIFRRCKTERKEPAKR